MSLVFSVYLFFYSRRPKQLQIFSKTKYVWFFNVYLNFLLTLTVFRLFPFIGFSSKNSKILVNHQFSIVDLLLLIELKKCFNPCIPDTLRTFDKQLKFKYEVQMFTLSVCVIYVNRLTLKPFGRPFEIKTGIQGLFQLWKNV